MTTDDRLRHSHLHGHTRTGEGIEYHEHSHSHVAVGAMEPIPVVPIHANNHHSQEELMRLFRPTPQTRGRA